MKKVVLDTNAYSQLIGGEKKVLDVLNQAAQIIIPSFVIAELISGFKSGSKENWNRSILEQFEARATVQRYYPTDETIEIYAEILFELKTAGTPIPTHDIWIAAIAIENGCTIITYDKHFLKIAKARVWKAIK